MTPRVASQPSIVLRVLHWLIFVEALYCYVVLGIAYSLGEGMPAALDVLSCGTPRGGMAGGWAPVPLTCLYRRCVRRYQNIPTFPLVALKIPVLWSLTTMEK
jgi:hypothetical protein